VFRRSGELCEYRIADAPEVDLARTGEVGIGGMAVEVVDPVTIMRR